MASDKIDPRDVCVVGVARTPMGGFLGALSSLPATKLGSIAIDAALRRANVDPALVQEVFFGNVLSANLGQAPARQAALGAGIPNTVVCTTVNKVCASGMKATMFAAQSIQLGINDIAVAGGMESMSNAPKYLSEARKGSRFGHDTLVDGMLKDGLWDVYNDYAMGMCAELCSDNHGLTREDQDAYAIQSNERGIAARDSGAFPNHHSSLHFTRQIHTTLRRGERKKGMGSLPSLAALAAFLSLLAVGHCAAEFNANEAPGVDFNTSDAAVYWGPWTPARATWYGQPNGAGPDDNGGACGFKQTNQYPFVSMTSCGNQPLFKDGKGCGSCYKIRCKKDPACSGRSETVIITDMNYYPVSKYHFDLSGTAFGRLAKPGLNDKLRHSGIIDIEFTRVPCEFPGLKIGFHVEEFSNPVYFAVLVEYEDGDGDVVQVDLMESRTAHGPATGVWTPMRESWGSIWRLDTNHRLQAPFSIRIRNESGRTLVAKEVIPANWRPNTFYRSFVQYS